MKVKDTFEGQEAERWVQAGGLEMGVMGEKVGKVGQLVDDFRSKGSTWIFIILFFTFVIHIKKKHFMFMI